MIKITVSTHKEAIEIKFKEDYIEQVKCVAVDGLNKLRIRTLDEIFDNMGVK